MDYHHTPVLLSEVLMMLAPQPGQNFVDATLGGGGYTQALLTASVPNGKVLAIDLDQAALENARIKFSNYKDRLKLAHGNFRDISDFVLKHKLVNISGIVADIGLSSFQLDNSGKGISFQKHELLDMRFDSTSQEPDARFILKTYPTPQLASIFSDYGEEKYSHKIADAINKYKIKNEIKYTDDLNEIIKSALPRPVAYKWQDTARRIYQALRIAVNHELANLEKFLPAAFNILAPTGKLAVVTFHSLEDRMVKKYFKSLSKGCVCPPEFPVCNCGQNPQGKLLTPKAVMASQDEVSSNSRSMSAKLRVIQKI